MMSIPAHARVMLAAILMSMFVVFPSLSSAQTSAPIGRSSDVPMFRGNPARSGAMPGPGVSGEPVLLWQTETASPTSSTPAIVGGVAYFGDGFFGGGGLRAVDIATGQDLWTAALPGQPFGSSPAVVDGSAYIGDLGGNVTAVEISTGEVKWSVVAGGDVTSSPAVVDGMLYIRNGEDVLYALDAATGEERWTFATGGDGGYTLDTAPAVADGVVYMTTIDSEREDSLFALDAETGDELWRFSPDTPGLHTPAVVDGVIYAAGGGGVYAIDVATGDQIWNAPIGEGFSAPAVSDGKVVVHTRNDLVAVDVGSGEELWRYATGGSWSAPTMVDGVVYVGSNGVAARMGLHLIDSETGEAITRFEEVGTMNGSPVVTSGVVYAASDDGVFAFGPPSAVPATPETATSVIGPFVFTTEVGQNNEPMDEVASYPSGTAAIYIVYDFAGVPEGAAWRMVWTVDGEVIYDGGDTWQRGEEGRAADWISANEGALPDGTYEVVLYLDGVEQQRGTVTIGG